MVDHWTRQAQAHRSRVPSAGVDLRLAVAFLFGAYYESKATCLDALRRVEVIRVPAKGDSKEG